MDGRKAVKEFFFPRLTRSSLLRMAAVAMGAFALFYFVLVPVRLRGKSMEPTLRDGSFHFIFAPAYAFSPPKAGDIVGIKLAGRKVLLLKRVVALEGDRVAFQNGSLIVNGSERPEPYLKGEYDWNYPEREVGQGSIFVVGDNRGAPMERHDFGVVPKKRIMGTLIW